MIASLIYMGVISFTIDIVAILLAGGEKGQRSFDSTEIQRIKRIGKKFE
jgi:hypothetical protein